MAIENKLLSVPQLLGQKLHLVPDLCRVQAIFIVVIFTELLVMILVLYSSTADAFDWDRLGTGSLYAQWVALLIAAILCQLHHRFQNLPLLTTYLLAYGIILIVHGLVALTAQWILSWPLQETIDWHWIMKTQCIAGILGLLILHYFYVQYRLRQQEQAELRLKLEALQARIHPHFLFNSMNSIASLTKTNALLAEHAILDLSELFRASLKENNKLVTLAQEWHLCECYLRIEQLRLGKRLRYSYTSQVNLHAFAIPNLCLQPLIENAVLHGIQRRLSGGTVTTDFFILGDALFIEIRNSLPQPNAPKTQGSHQMALVNIQDRLEVLFSGRAAVSSQLIDDIYLCTLRMPLVAVPCNKQSES